MFLKQGERIPPDTQPGPTGFAHGNVMSGLMGLSYAKLVRQRFRVCGGFK